jgi:hypothetical protein
MAAHLITASGSTGKLQSASLITVSTGRGTDAPNFGFNDDHLDRDPFHVSDLVQSRKSLLSRPNIAAPQLLP